MKIWRSAVAIACGGLAACTPFLNSLDDTFDNNQTPSTDAASDGGADLRFFRYLKTIPSVSSSQFGRTIAATSDTAAVSAPFEDVGVQTPMGSVVRKQAGAVYLFSPVRDLQPPLRFTLPNADDNDGLVAVVDGPEDAPPRTNGWGPLSVALSDEVLVVGAPGEDSGSQTNESDNSAQDSGAVYVYDRGTPDLAPQYIKPPYPHAGALFGLSLALSGTRLVIGAPGEPSGTGDSEEASAKFAGGVYVYERTEGTYVLKSYVRAPFVQSGDEFGFSVAVDGDVLVAGAFAEDGGSTGVGGDLHDDSKTANGAAYVYRHADDGWGFEAYLKPSLAFESSYFGLSVAVSGERVAVGAPNAPLCRLDEVGGAFRGAVYTFSESGGAWSPESCLSPRSNTGHSDLFGWDVKMVGDRLGVGAPWDSSRTEQAPDAVGSPISGAAYLYLYYQRGDAVPWQYQRFIKAPNAASENVFGYSIALASGLLAVGAPQESSSASDVAAPVLDDSYYSGAAYLFETSP